MIIRLVAFVYHVLLKFPSTRILKCGKPGANDGLFVEHNITFSCYIKKY